MNKELRNLIAFIKSNDGIADKARLSKIVKKKFNLTRDRSVYYSEYFALRFSSSASMSFSNTILSLSNLQKYDELSFIVCLVTPKKNILYLANTTFLQKISHSSQELRIDNIRGSFNGSDIVREFNGLVNSPENFGGLYAIHRELGFQGNLPRLVEATTNIVPAGAKFEVSNSQLRNILRAPERSLNFVSSLEYKQLKADLDSKVSKYKNEILIAGFIENVNIRGRIIEYLIVGEDDYLRSKLVDELRKNAKKIPRFETKNELADYTKLFNGYETATDIKTKIMILNSNPKAYNIDKLLEFLSKDKSVFLFYFIGIEPNKIVDQVLVSVFQKDLLKSTITLKHWSGRNSRGVIQFQGDIIHRLILNINNDIDLKASKEYLQSLVDLV